MTSRGGRTVSLPQGSWQEASMDGVDITSEDLQFLIGFEEILPEQQKEFLKNQKIPAKKSKKTKRPIDVEPEDDEETVVVKGKKAKKSTKQKKITTEDDLYDGDDDDEQEIQKQKSSKETGDSVEKKKKKKVKRGKRGKKNRAVVDGEEPESESGKVSNSKKAKKGKRSATSECGDVTSKKVRFDDSAASSSKVGGASDTTFVSLDNEEETDVEDAGIDMSEWKQFELPAQLVSALKEMGFAHPTDIQSEVLLPAIRDRLDILGAAETGSGKTLAFALPVLTRLLQEDRRGNGPRALVLAPTRELVMQIMKCFNALCKHTPFNATSIVGGLAEVKQLRVTSHRIPEVLVATPGRLWDMMKEAEPSSYLGDFSGLQCLVIDETDRMMEMGHFKEMKDILDTVKGQSEFAAAGKLQSLVFSATLTYVVPEKEERKGKKELQQKRKELTPKEKIRLLMEVTGLRDANRVVDITRAFGTAEKLVETRLNCSGLLDKDTHLVYLLKRYSGRTLIFTNSVDASRRLYGVLNHLKMGPLMLQGNMIQKQRLRNLENFTERPDSILLATDVAARGLDIKGIEHVIHYQVPRTAEMYIHRSGRTARAAQTGLSVVMVDPKDAHLYRKICTNLNREKNLPVFPIDAPELLSALRERVRLASEMDVLKYRAKKIQLNENWFDNMARDADLILDDREGESEFANEEYSNLLRKQDQAMADLKREMATPLPNISRMNVPRTRYITPEISALYNTSVSTHALDDLDKKLDNMTAILKRNRDVMKTHNIKGRKFKKKY